MIYLKCVKDVINLIISHNIIAIIATLNRKKHDNARKGDSDEKSKCDEIGIVNGHQVLLAQAQNHPHLRALKRAAVQGRARYPVNHNYSHVQDQEHETEIDIVHPRWI